MIRVSARVAFGTFLLLRQHHRELSYSMQHGSDYQRGFQAALADAKGGWAMCWMQARQLAEDAVYSRFGLTEEQSGYSAGLDECFPGGVAEQSGYLNSPLPTFCFTYNPDHSGAPVTPPLPPQPLPPVPAFGAHKQCDGQCSKQHAAPGLGVVGEEKKELTAAEKKAFLARFV